MPRRTSEHIIGDRGQLAVQKVLGDAGFAVDVVHHDYGDDLLVQTSHAGEIDACRLWFQVKSTTSIDRHRRKNGSFAYSVPYGHAVRWVRSLDLVVFVLWDVEGDVGYFAEPTTQVSNWKPTGQATVTLRLQAGDVLDVPAARRLAWESRLLHHFRYRFLAARGDDPADSYGLRSPQVGMLALEFLRLVGIVVGDGGTPERFRPSVETHSALRAEFKRLSDAALRANDLTTSTRTQLYKAAIRVVLNHVEVVTDGLGTPDYMLIPAVGVLLMLSGLSEDAIDRALEEAAAEYEAEYDDEYEYYEDEDEDYDEDEGEEDASAG